MSEEQIIYRVLGGSIDKMILMSETKQGYKAKSYESGFVWQIWKRKTYTSCHGEPKVYHTEMCFFNLNSAKKYAMQQLQAMVGYHRIKKDSYEKRFFKIEHHNQ